MKLRSLRVRLALWMLLLLGLTQAAVSAAFFLLTTQWLQAQVDHNLRVSATQVATVITEDGDSFDLEDISFQFDQGSPATQAFLQGQQFFVRLIDRQAGVVIKTSAVNDVPVSAAVTAWANHADPLYETFAPDGGDEIRVYSLPIQKDTQFAVQVGMSLAPMHATQAQVLRLLVIAFVITAVFALLGGWFVGTRALKPIYGITRTAQAIHAADLARRLDLQASDDELEQLVRTFNAMLDRIEAAFRQQRQFTADAAHELRTPLSIMQTGLDVALSQERTAGQYRAMLESTREEVQRLTQLANTLLLLARADTHELPLNLSRVDLSMLLDAVLDQVCVLAEGKHITLRREITPGLYLQGDEDRLIQVVLNLVENAIKYASDGGCVQVAARMMDEMVQFKVRNSGRIIPAAELERIFDRFYRVDRSRNRTQGGFGLGLAITKQLIELHGGTIEACSDAAHDTEFVVTLPRDTD